MQSAGQCSAPLYLCNTLYVTVAAERLWATVLMLREQNTKHASLFHSQTWMTEKKQVQRLLFLGFLFLAAWYVKSVEWYGKQWWKCQTNSASSKYNL